MYRGDKVLEQTRLMTSAEYVAASSAIAQVQAKYDQLSLIAQKDTIYKNYARKKGQKRKSAVLSSDNEEEVDLEQLLEKADTTSIPHIMQIRKCQVILTPLESALKDALKKFKPASPTSELSDTEPAEDSGNSDKESADNKDQMQSQDKEEQTVEDSDKNKEQSEDNQEQSVEDSDKNNEQSEESAIVLSGDEDNTEKQDSKGTVDANNVQKDVKESASKEEGETTVKTDTPTNGNNVQKNVKPISSKHQAANSLLNKAHQSNRQGSWRQVTNFRKGKRHRKSLVKREKRKKVLKTKHCPYKNCKVKEAMKKDMVKHIKNVHPDFQWRCRYCPKKYGTRAARNKHEIFHIHGYRFFCTYKNCTQKFVFKGELEEHERKHKRKNLWSCHYKDCDKAYPCKRTRDSHVHSHTSEDWTCASVLDDGSTCGQECVSKNHLKQDIRGEHGEGWTSRCGKEHYKWPALKYKHENDCKDCIRMKKKSKK